jgi:hypothetical protein
VRIFAFVAAQKADFPVRTLCRVCQVSVSGFYAYAARAAAGPGPAAAARAVTAGHVARVHRESRQRYGSPRVTAQLAREGLVVNHKAVEREMARQGLAGRCSRRKIRTTRRDPSQAPAADLVHREFARSRADELWIGDATCIAADEGWCYLATVVDACSRRLLGWSITDHLRTELCLDALLAAVATRGGRPHLAAGIIFHTDHGTQGGFNWSSQHLVIMEVFGGRTTRGDDRSQCGAGGAATAVGCGSCVAASDAVTGPAGALACGAAGVLAADRLGRDDGRGRGGHRCVVAGRGAVVPARWRNAADQPGRARRPLPVVR